MHHVCFLSHWHAFYHLPNLGDILGSCEAVGIIVRDHCEGWAVRLSYSFFGVGCKPDVVVHLDKLAVHCGEMHCVPLSSMKGSISVVQQSRILKTPTLRKGLINLKWVL